MATETDLSAQDADKTEEDLWKEFEADEAGDDAGDDAPDDTTPAEWKAEDDDRADEGQPPQSDPSDDDQRPPEAAGEDDQDTPTHTPASVDPDELKKQLEERDLRLADLEHQLRSVKGRESAAQRKLQELLARDRSAPSTPADGDQADDAPSQDRADGDAPAGKKPRNKYSPEQMAALRDDYPDLAALFDTLEDLTSRQDEDDQFRQQVTQERQQAEEARREEEWQKFTAVHRDGTEFVRKNWDRFQLWLDDQPGAIRRIAEANMANIVDGQRTATIVSRFKEFMGHTPPQGGQPQPGQQDRQHDQNRLPPKRRKQLEGASGPTSNGRTPIRNGPPANMSEEAAWNYWARVEKENERRA